MRRSTCVGPLPALLCLALAGCPTEPPPRVPEDFGEPTSGDGQVPVVDTPKAAEPRDDAPEISRSRGTKGGVVVLWPRVWPRSEEPGATELATKVQKRLEELARRA